MAADIIRLPSSATAPARTGDVIKAEIQSHLDAVRALAFEYAAVAGCDVSSFDRNDDAPDEVLSLQRAAHAIGWEERRLRRHIVKHNRANPRDPIGHQPGGMPNTAWCIPMKRLRRYVRDLRD